MAAIALWCFPGKDGGMPNLLRTEAADRHALVTVDGYDVDLDLTVGSTHFESMVSIRFGCSQPGAETFVEIVPAVLHRATLNGVDLPVSGLGADGRLVLPDLAAENVLTVSATMEYSRSGEGLHRFTDPEDGLDYVYQMSFLDMASRVFACFEQPDLKARYRLSVTAPEDWTVVSNEAGTQVEPGRWEFVETEPIPTYCMTLVAGHYHSVYREHAGVRFGMHARRSYREALETDLDELFDVTFGCWDRLHELYGVPYAFGTTYDQCFVPEFNAGAMENPGCVTFRDEAFMFRSAVTDSRREARATTIAHEMAHMWFGDLVTMTWWDDLWLNESFADCMGVRAATEGTRFVGSYAGDAMAAMGGYKADERPSTHPVADEVLASDDALNNFDGISYAKGGAVLNQLATWVGEQAFYDGLRLYFDRYRFGNARLADLMACLAETSGRDLDDWSRRWLRTTGPNTITADVTVKDGAYSRACLVQTASPDHPTLRPHRLRLGLYRYEDDEVVRYAEVMQDVDGERTEVPGLVGLPAADLLMVNDGNLTYAKIRLDDRSFASLPRILSAMNDPVTRALLWNLLYDMVRDGDLSVRRYLEILSVALPGESSVAAVEAQLNRVRTLVDVYADPSERDELVTLRRLLANGLRESAEPGAGIQLSALRHEITAVVDAVGVVWLRDLLAGRRVPPGVTVDADLRWAVMTRLAVLGEAGESDIDAELARDPSSAGHRHAATCRASLPTRAAKEMAWHAVQYGDKLSNHELRATADGFWWPEQAEVTREYVVRFFTESGGGIGKRMPWEARHLGHLLYPIYAVSDETVVAADAMLADEENPHLRRIVADQTDEVARALRSRRGTTDGTRRLRSRL